MIINDKTKTGCKVVQTKMILECPECKTRFMLPSPAIPIDGRKVRCSNCKHVWHQEKPIEARKPTFAQSVTEAKTDNVEESKTTAFIKKESKEGLVPFLIGMAIVFAVFFAFLMFNTTIPVGQGLAFDNMQTSRLGDEALEVKGSIVNTMDDARKVPVIRLTYIGLEGVEGDSLLFHADKEILEAGEILPISFVLDNLPPDLKDVRITFDINAPMQTEGAHAEPAHTNEGENQH